jgi:hypothetical protein
LYVANIASECFKVDRALHTRCTAGEDTNGPRAGDIRACDLWATWALCGRVK